MLIFRLADISDLYVIGYLYRQNNLTNEFLDLKLVEKEVLVEIFGQIVQYNFLVCRFAAILDLYVNGYLYRQNNQTNAFLDLKLVEKKVLVEIFGQIVDYTIFLICRLAAILNNGCSRVMSR